MAACLRSLKLGVPPRVPGTAGGGHLAVVPPRRRGSQGGVQSAPSTPCRHLSSSLRSAAAPQHQQEVDVSPTPSCNNSPSLDAALTLATLAQGEGAVGLDAQQVLKRSAVIGQQLHSFDPLGCALSPAHTLDDIEVQCSVTPHRPERNTSVRTFRLPSNALWYPRGAQHRGDNILYSVSYSEIESQVLESVAPSGGSPQAHNREVEGGPTCDMTLFIQSVGLQDGEVQLCSPTAGPGGPKKAVPTGRPNAEQLSIVFNKLADTLPKLFTQPLDYTIYAQDIVFENRIRGVRTVGLFPYVRQVALLRTIGHLRFAYVKFEILKITKHPEEGTVKVRWRIQGLSGLKAFLQFWKIKIWDWKTVQDQMVSWYDGFSTFYVGGDGLVYKHEADSMMPDEEPQVVEKGPLAVKMAALLGLVRQPGGIDVSSLLSCPLQPLSLLQKDRDTCSQLMLPLEKIH